MFDTNWDLGTFLHCSRNRRAVFPSHSCLHNSSEHFTISTAKLNNKKWNLGQAASVQLSALSTLHAYVCILNISTFDCLKLSFLPEFMTNLFLGDPTKGCYCFGDLWCNLKATRLLTIKNKVEAQQHPQQNNRSGGSWLSNGTQNLSEFLFKCPWRIVGSPLSFEPCLRLTLKPSNTRGGWMAGFVILPSTKLLPL